MLRIAHVKASESHRRVLRIEGRIVGPWVEELRRSCDWALAAAPGLTLDLAGVTFADRTGVALLRSLRGRGVALANCSAFLAAQLKG